jgi:single-strand DNA-binding protein
MFVEGRLTYQTWDDKKTGAKRSKVLVTVENFQFIDSKPKGESAPSASGAPEARRASPAPAGGAKPAAEEYDYTQDVEDDTIPF